MSFSKLRNFWVSLILMVSMCGVGTLRAINVEDLPGYSRYNVVRANPELVMLPFFRTSLLQSSETSFSSIDKEIEKFRSESESFSVPDQLSDFYYDHYLGSTILNSIMDWESTGLCWLYGIQPDTDWRATYNSSREMQDAFDHLFSDVGDNESFPWYKREIAKATFAQEWIIATQYEVSPIKGTLNIARTNLLDSLYLEHQLCSLGFWLESEDYWYLRKTIMSNLGVKQIKDYVTAIDPFLSPGEDATEYVSTYSALRMLALDSPCLFEDAANFLGYFLSRNIHPIFFTEVLEIVFTVVESNGLTSSFVSPTFKPSIDSFILSLVLCSAANVLLGIEGEAPISPLDMFVPANNQSNTLTDLFDALDPDNPIVQRSLEYYDNAVERLSQREWEGRQSLREWCWCAIFYRQLISCAELLPSLGSLENYPISLRGISPLKSLVELLYFWINRAYEGSFPGFLEGIPAGERVKELHCIGEFIFRSPSFVWDILPRHHRNFSSLVPIIKLYNAALRAEEGLGVTNSITVGKTFTQAVQAYVCLENMEERSWSGFLKVVEELEVHSIMRFSSGEILSDLLSIYALCGDKAATVRLTALDLRQEERNEWAQMILPWLNKFGDRSMLGCFLAGSLSIPRSDRNREIFAKLYNLREYVEPREGGGPLFAVLVPNSFPSEERARIISEVYPFLFVGIKILTAYQLATFLPSENHSKAVSLLAGRSEICNSFYRAIHFIAHEDPETWENFKAKVLETLQENPSPAVVRSRVSMIMNRTRIIARLFLPLVPHAESCGRRLRNLEHFKNPYKLYQTLSRKRVEDVDLSRIYPKIHVFRDEEGAPRVCHLNPAFFKDEMPSVTLTYGGLPTYSRNMLRIMMQDLRDRGSHSDAVRNEISNVTGLSIEMLERAALADNHVQGLLDRRGKDSEQVPVVQERLIHLLNFIKNLPKDVEEGQILSQQEEAFVRCLAAIRSCETGKEEGINAAFLYIVPSSVSQRREIAHSVDEGCSGEGVNPREDLSHQRYKRDICKAILPEIEKMFSGNNLFTKEVCNVRAGHDVRQASHQGKYLRNLIGKDVGLHQKLKLDIHSQVLYDTMLRKTKQQVLETFYMYLSPASIVKALTAASGEFGDDQDSIELLLDLGVLKEVRESTPEASIAG